MRSRYTAFVRGDVDYLIATSHPPQNRASLGETVQTVQWIGLEVVRTRQGQATDQRGSVEFVATYVPKGQFGPPQQMRERSEFCKRGDRWFYRTQ
jgi:SEC-C motif domain protein